MQVSPERPIEEMAAKHANAFALAVYEAYGQDLEKLTEMENVLCYLFNLLENEAFSDVLKTLCSALDCPISEIAYDEDELDTYLLGFMCDFENVVLQIGMEQINNEP